MSFEAVFFVLVVFVNFQFFIFYFVSIVFMEHSSLMLCLQKLSLRSYHYIAVTRWSASTTCEFGWWSTDPTLLMGREWWKSAYSLTRGDVITFQKVCVFLYQFSKFKWKQEVETLSGCNPIPLNFASFNHIYSRHFLFWVAVKNDDDLSHWGFSS